MVASDADLVVKSLTAITTTIKVCTLEWECRLSSLMPGREQLTEYHLCWIMFLEKCITLERLWAMTLTFDFIEFASSLASSSTCCKLKHISSKSSITYHSHFWKIVHIWNVWPNKDQSLCLSLHFFNPTLIQASPVPFRFQCPCNKFTLVPSSWTLHSLS